MPRVRFTGWGHNPIDTFVLARLEKAGIQPSPEAARLTLLRRVTFDLTGLAPTPAERAAFLADRAPGAYEHVVDRLLASPHFGERWAQHWLDVVRYAETEGFKFDRLRPEAHRYRDYIIAAFNADLPYDRFLRQQIAGDELEPDNPRAQVATGLLRLPPEESNGSNYRQIRQTILDDITDVFGSTFLGMTVGCARCHDHKFDDLTQKDYFRLQAFFAPLLQRDDLTLASRQAQAHHHRRLAAWEQATASVRAEIEKLLRPKRREIFEEMVVVFDADTQQALRTEPARRTPLQHQLAQLASKQINLRYQRAAHKRLPPPQRARYEQLKKELATFDHLKPAPLPVAMTITDTGKEAPPTYRLTGGNYLRPSKLMQPRFPAFLEENPPHIERPLHRPTSTGRRSALAKWLTRPDHPLTARVIANRLWQHYLGKGIVGTPNDFGAQGEKASHPALLDYLASDLVRNGWRLKALHRLIVTSATYRQAAAADRNPMRAQAQKVDPGNALLWHARVKRRDAEAIRDLMLQASGRLNQRMGGPSAAPALPPALMESRYKWDADVHPEDRDRRSVFVLAQRNLAYPLFSVFDTPDRLNSCPVRAVTTTAPQALTLLNGEFTLNQARSLAGRLLKQYRSSQDSLIRAAYLRVLGREPADDEFTAAKRFLAQQTRLAMKSTIDRRGLPEPLPSSIPTARAVAVVDFCHALLNTAELLFIE
jgi:hypothetical protein